MGSFVDLPQDILTLICQLLSLRDISFLRRTCRELFLSISKNKQLWIHILKREIHLRGLRLPSYRRDLEEVGSACVESWTRATITLNNSYRKSCEIQVLGVPRLSCITWLRLIRGRWCIVASSDFTQSCLLVYDGKNGLKCEAQFYFPGPVMDGQLEDTGCGINLAITIGTTIPYIDILKLSYHASGFRLERLASISDASCIRFLDGTLVGFAVQNGDDSFPQIFDWKSRTGWTLDPAERFTVSIEERGICWGMTIWHEYIVVVFGKTVQIFSKPGVDATSQPFINCIIPLRLAKAIYEIQFFLYENSPFHFQNNMKSSLYIIARERSSEINVLELSCESLEEIPAGFTLKHLGRRQPVENGADLKGNYITFAMAAGLSGSAIAWCGSVPWPREVFELPCLMLSKIDVTRIRDWETHGLLKSSIIISTIAVGEKALPLLYHYPCSDFDDARGVMLLGTSVGELRVVYFHGSTAFLSNSLNDDIRVSAFSNENVASHVSTTVVSLNLPLYYAWQIEERKKAKVTSAAQPYNTRIGSIECESRDVPTSIIQDMLNRREQWDVLDVIPSGWSNNWSDFEYLYQWVAPTFRWGCRDDIFDVTAVTDARYEMPFLGDPVPILFSIDNYRVIFRIGRRYYLMWYENDNSATLGFICKINTEPGELTAAMIQNLNNLNDFGHLTDVTTQGSDRGLDLQRNLIDMYDRIIALVDKVKVLQNGQKPEEWSLDRWVYIGRIYDQILHRKSPWDPKALNDY